ncbi:hypothetical protein AB2L57_05480 [Microbacterium sp. HA-8]|uniref:hypothetical protein n=1 Tax=Microbacterium sp. HA-8 TaxID=3234200 RepID=UPI0038F719C8
MLTRRARRWTVAAGAAAIVLVSLGVSVELAARERVEARLSTFEQRMPGVDAALADTPALWQLATGRIALRVTVPDAALDAVVRCSSEQEIDVRSVPDGLVMTRERALGGASLPVELLLVPQRRPDGGWLLVADSVSAGGISIPADRALRMLSGRAGDDAGFASRLLDGIPLPSGGGLTVTGIAFADGSAQLDLSIPTTRTDPSPGDALEHTRSCMGSPESPEG